MNAIRTENLLAQLRWRYATKQFDPNRRISASDWAALEETLVLTPSSFELQPWKFLVVTDAAKYDELLGLEAQSLATGVAAAAGHRAAGDKYAAARKVRFPKAEVLAKV